MSQNSFSDTDFLVECKNMVHSADTSHKLLHEVKPALFGKDSLISFISSSIKSASIEEKKILGQRLSFLRSEVEKMISDKHAEIQEQEIERKLSAERIDGSLPCRPAQTGSIHPITKVIEEMVSILYRYGFRCNYGPEIESDYFNFTALNIPAHHPARDMHDTFYVNLNDERGDKMLLRTHTTAVDIKTVLKQGVPIKSISVGKVFRNESDRTHSPMFHQLELLEIEKGINMSHLKGYIMSLLREFFESDNINIRLRPSFFPFTEPSAEVDIGYTIKDDKIIIGEEVTGYMEIMGCGMLHPNVLKNCNVDPETYNGAAFGLGVERMAMLKYGFKDLRDFFTSDFSWINNNSFNFIDL